MLEENINDIARTLVMENGKTLAEAKGELRRAIENVEVACGIPMLMQGYNLEDISHGRKICKQSLACQIDCALPWRSSGSS